jgi:outer membrane protein assembly factor BamB
MVCTSGLAAHADPDVTVLAGSVWPMYGHDVKHTFRSDLVGPANGNLLVPVKLGNSTTQAAVAPDGVLVFGAGFNTFGVRIDGKLLWKTRVGAETLNSSPALDGNGFLYIGGRDNQLWKKDTASGLMACKHYISSDADIKSSPTISVKYSDRVYVPDTDAHVYAIRTSGPSGLCDVIWSAQLDDGTMSSVSLADSVPGNGDALGDIIAADRGGIYRIRDDGNGATVLAKRIIGRTDGPTPLVHPTTGNIYMGSIDHRLYALRPDLSELFSPVDLGSRLYTSAALSADGATIYVATDHGQVHALDAVTGTERPGFPFFAVHNRFKARGAAIVVDAAGTLYFSGQDRHVRALSPTGSVVWDVKIAGRAAPPTIVDGGLVIPTTSGGGNLYRFCPTPVGPPTATQICGFTIDTTTP